MSDHNIYDEPMPNDGPITYGPTTLIDLRPSEGEHIHIHRNEDGGSIHITDANGKMLRGFATGTLKGDLRKHY